METPAGLPSADILCHKCGGRLPLGERLLIGEVVDCVACSAHSEVSNLDPLVLVPFRRIEEEPEDFENFEEFDLL